MTMRALFASVASPKALPHTLDSIALVAESRRDVLTTPARIADLIAQTANETGGYVTFEEDLRYRAATLLSQWPSHFTQEQAAAAVGNPVEIASRAYGGRMGNASYPSRDGYTYRGRGMLQLTGKSAYDQFGKRLGLPLVAHPELAADPGVSLTIALEFYTVRGVWAAIDAGLPAKARHLTNGGTIGLDNVNRLRAVVLAAMRG